MCLCALYAPANGDSELKQKEKVKNQFCARNFHRWDDDEHDEDYDDDKDSSDGKIL